MTMKQDFDRFNEAVNQLKQAVKNAIKGDYKGILTVYLIIMIFIALFAIGGKGDYEQALASEQAYCERVADGVHTNYERINCEKWGE